MRRDEARNYDSSREINMFLIWMFGDKLLGFPNGSNLVVFDEDGAVEDDIPCWVNGYDACVGV